MIHADALFYTALTGFVFTCLTYEWKHKLCTRDVTEYGYVFSDRTDRVILADTNEWIDDLGGFLGGFETRGVRQDWDNMDNDTKKNPKTIVQGGGFSFMHVWAGCQRGNSHVDCSHYHQRVAITGWSGSRWLESDYYFVYILENRAK